MGGERQLDLVYMWSGVGSAAMNGRLPSESMLLKLVVEPFGLPAGCKVISRKQSHRNSMHLPRHGFGSNVSVIVLVGLKVRLRGPGPL